MPSTFVVAAASWEIKSIVRETQQTQPDLVHRTAILLLSGLFPGSLVGAQSLFRLQSSHHPH